MSLLKTFIYFGLSFSLIFASSAEEAKKEAPQDTNKCMDKEEFSETDHQVTINGKPINYKAVAGTLLLKDEKCDSKASIFFISYTKEGTKDLSERPITFCFNGGPGSSSVWLHLGVLGPKRVFMNENGDPLPPYHLVDNEYSILDLTDLVFIDPVSTGFSRAIPPEDAKNYHGVEETSSRSPNLSAFTSPAITAGNRPSSLAEKATEQHVRQVWPAISTTNTTSTPTELS